MASSVGRGGCPLEGMSTTAGDLDLEATTRSDTSMRAVGETDARDIEFLSRESTEHFTLAGFSQFVEQRKYHHFAARAPPRWRSARRNVPGPTPRIRLKALLNATGLL